MPAIKKKNTPTVSKADYASVGYRARRRSKLSEYATLAVALAFALGIGITAWLTEGRIFINSWNAILAQTESRRHSTNVTANCSKPENKNTPYCANQNAKTKATWEGISRNQDGKSPQFSLHGRNN